jgi:phage tail sheath protein FI
MVTALQNVPGVQIQEVRLGPPVITGVPTSIAGFIGVAPRADQRVNQAVLLTSADQFQAIYMLGTPAIPAQPAVPATVATPAIPASPAVPAVPDATRSTPLSRAVIGFFTNGGSLCWVVNTGAPGGGDTEADLVIEGLPLLELIDEVTILAAPGHTSVGVYNALIGQAARRGDRIAILDPPPVSVLTPAGSTFPDLSLILPGGANYPPVSPDSIYAAFYYPRIIVGPELDNDPDFPAGEAVSPSGHIAGLYARSDAAKGVHKAPANEALRGTIGLEQVLTDAQQDVLNPAGVNALRLFGGSPVPIVWGARTLQQAAAPQNADYIYLSTRRLVMYIEESLQDGLRWAVFEPNTLALRQQIVRSVRGFLNGVWRDGGLFGETPDQAYYVRFPPLFNTDEDRAAGRLTLEIGLRVTFPAEFIVIRIGVILQDATTV